MPFASANGYDMSLNFNTDTLGMLYVGLAISWTICLLYGIYYLAANRKLPFLRMRDMTMCFFSVVMLHVYWCLCMIAYVLNGNLPCATEYWIMSVYLPFGIALYQASNTQLLHVACVQEQFTDKEAMSAGKLQRQHTPWTTQTLREMWSSLAPAHKTLIGIGLGIFLQVSLCHGPCGPVAYRSSELTVRRACVPSSFSSSRANSTLAWAW